MEQKAEVELLMREGLLFAESMLLELGEFHPFGMGLGSARSIVHVGASDGTELPSSQALLRILEEGLRNRVATKEFVATAVLTNVVVRDPATTEKTDAVQIGLEHQGGYSADVFIPYELISHRDVVFGEIFAQDRRRRIFG